MHYLPDPIHTKKIHEDTESDEGIAKVAIKVQHPENKMYGVRFLITTIGHKRRKVNKIQ